MEKYIVDGKGYDVSPEKLETFLQEFPNAVKYQEPGKTTDSSTETQTVESSDMDSGSDDGGLVYEYQTPDKAKFPDAVPAWGKSTDGGKNFEVVDADKIPEDWLNDPKFKQVYDQENKPQKLKDADAEKAAREALTNFYGDVSGMPKWALPYVTNFTGGAAGLVGGLFKTVESTAENLMGMTAGEQREDGVNPVSEALDSFHDFTDAFDTKYYDEKGNTLQVDQLLEKKEYGQALKLASEQAAESAPSMIASVYNPVIGGALMGVSTTGTTYKDDLKNRPEEALNDVIGNAMWAGGSEFLTEWAGGKFFRSLNGLKKSGAAEDVIRDYTKNYVTRFVGRTLGSGVGESITESVNSLIQDGGEVLFYDDKKTQKELISNVINSAVPALLMGGFGGGISSVSKQEKSNVYKFVAPQKWKQEHLNLGKQIYEASNDLDQAEESMKPTFEQDLKNLQNKKKEHEKTLVDSFDSMSDKEIIDYAKNIDAVNKNLNIINNNKYSESAQKKAEQRNIELIQDNLNSIGQEYTGKDVEVEKTIGEALKSSEIIEERLKKAKGINKEDLEINILKTEKDIEALSDANKDGVKNSDGAFIGKDKNGKATIYINQNVAAMAGATNVLGHELLHYMVSKKFKTDNESMAPLVDELKTYLKDNHSDVFGRVQQRIDKFYTNKNGSIKDGALEEYLNVFSDLIATKKIDIKEVQSKGLKNEIKDVMAGFGFGQIKLDSAKDVVSFLSTYNKNINRKGLLGKLMGAKILDVSLISEKLTEGEIKSVEKKSISTSKEASNKVQSIYEEQGVAGAMDIIEQFKPIVSRIAEKRREAPNFDRELLMSEIEIGERGIFDLISKYDPDSGVPLAAYINKFLPARAIEASRRVLGEEFTEDVSERVDIVAEEVAEVEVEAKPKKKKIILSDRLGVKGRVDKAIKTKLPELDIENLNFKTLKDQTPEITGEMFGISPKKLISGANITKKELQSAQMFINKNADVLISMLPEGATASGTATGVPQTLLKAFYTKTDRAKMAKTGTKAGLAIQVKNDIKKTDFLETFGIIDGKPDRTDRNTSARVLALANQTGKMMTNQAVREQLLEQKRPLTAIQLIGDGKSAVMFSKSLRNLNIDQQVIFWDGLPEVAAKTNPSLKNILDKKTIKNILKEVYGDQIKDGDLGKIAGDIVGYAKLYQPKVSKNKTQKEDKWTEFVANSFAEEANNIIKMLNLEINGVPVKFAGDLYDNINNVQQGRRVFVDAGNMLLKKYGPEKAARMVALLKGMYANNAKVGRGMFKTDLTDIKNPRVIPVKLKEGETFGRGRNQLFESVPAFNAYVDQIQGKNDKETKLFKEAYRNQKPLYAQTSVGAIKDKDYNGRLNEAKEARELIDDVMNMLDNDLDIAMFMISNLSSMKTPLRRAANLEYISDLVLEMNPKNLGKLAEYEHMIPANQMALRIIDAYKNKGGIKNLNKFYKNYNVAIIPKTMDDVLKLQGLQSKMLAGYNFDADPSWTRYYNFLTNGFDNIVSIRNINTNEVIGPRVKFSKSINKTETLNKAIMFSRSANNETKGITVLDFDDTLATTKSGVRAKIPNITGEPKPKRKVIFLAGGAGSGKGNVISKLGLKDQGFKMVNSDISLEWLKKNSGLPANMNDFTKEQRSKLGSLQHQARGIAKRKMTKYKGDADGVVVDGTGGSIKSMEKLVNEFKEKGYDVSMLFVETSLPVALERNAARKERSLLDKIVTRNHESVQGNKDGFKTMFGDRFMEVNTDNLSQKDAMPTKLTEQMNDFVSGYENRRLDAEEFASEGADILDQGGTFDFSEFNKVVEGQTAPLFNKAMKLQNKFGNKDMFVLTARPAESAPAIFEFLKANGLNIPLENITGLANSTSESKALWIADKVGEGYNDFYFADDALQNVQAVKNMLDQFDVKSKVQQAKVKFSKSMNDQFNDILENVTGIEANKRFSIIKGRKRGEGKGKFRVFIPPSHEDFVGLLYNFLGKGKEGNAHRDFFEKALIRPLNRANREYDTARQSVANDYKELNKQFEDVRKKLTKKTADGDFTFQDAVRVYLWDKHGHKIPGLSETDQIKLVELVAFDPQLQAYAETLNVISKQETYVNPTDGWNGGDIRMDLDDATGRIGRKEFFSEFIENADIIFSEENLNKIEAGYGKGVRESLEDMLYRIQTGRNRPTGQNAQVNNLMNYLNGSVGTVMFFNMRSALLQQMSIVNYINFADNNIFAAAKAFANQKQYWKDFAFIFNSDMLKQRRGGIQTDINGAELAASLRNSKDITRKLISKLLELGFLPTQIGDNIAIATGGAAYYRNRINKYIKQGMSQKEAEAAAFTDFQDITQSTQQSARPDMVSKQQASVIGKVILNFQNVTSQFNRLGKKAFQDIYNRRITKPNSTQMQSDISNAARITYYFAIQNAIFYTLQTALFAMMFDDDEEDVNNLFIKKRERLINGSIDSVLRGTGLIGGVVATLKNVAIAFARQRDVKYNPDESAVGLEALNLSPVLGIKFRKIVNAEKTLNYNKKVIKEMETFDIDNPQWSAVTNYTEAFTNVPLNRLYNKTQNVRQALNNDHSAWERTLMFLGWSQYNLDLENKKMEEIKEKTKGKKKTGRTARERKAKVR